MNTYLNTHLLIAINAVALAFIIGGTGWYYAHARGVLEREIRSNIESVELRLSELAVLTDRNGADELTERIIADCPRRSDFESHLMNLAKLGQRDLLTAQQLFESCGSFHAERKALMVSRLEREYDTLLQDLAYLRTLRDLTSEELSFEKWGDLIRLEKERSGFLSEQTELQRKIIQYLIEGNNATEVNELASQAYAVAESLTVTDVQIDAIRSELIE